MLDLEGWCPLYIGFGFGSHWYNAKKTEVPVQLQQEIIDKYGDKGFPFWGGNIHELYEWEVRQIYDYKVRRIREYLEDTENHNKVISPVISAFLFEVMPYVKSLDKLRGVVEQLKEVKNTEEYINENIKSIIPTYFSLSKCGVHLDKFLEPHSVFMDEFEMKWDDYCKYMESGGLDYLDRYISFEDAETENVAKLETIGAESTSTQRDLVHQFESQYGITPGMNVQAQRQQRAEANGLTFACVGRQPVDDIWQIYPARKHKAEAFSLALDIAESVGLTDYVEHVVREPVDYSYKMRPLADSVNDAARFCYTLLCTLQTAEKYADTTEINPEHLLNAQEIDDVVLVKLFRLI